MNVKKQATEVKTQAEFDRQCPPEAKACIIGLLNGYTGTEEAKAKFNESLDALTHSLKKYSQFPFIWIDAVCHSELLMDLNIMSEMIPTVVIYNPGKKEYMLTNFSNFLGILNSLEHMRKRALWSILKDISRAVLSVHTNLLRALRSKRETVSKSTNLLLRLKSKVDFLQRMMKF